MIDLGPVAASLLYRVSLLREANVPFMTAMLFDGSGQIYHGFFMRDVCL